MSLILFFGLGLFIIIIGFIYSGLVIRHHWNQSKLKRKDEPKKA
jgi:hypothetical protein